jgi:methionyl-tRNA synthetase
MINIDEFKKIELRVAKVLGAERVEGSEKLLNHTLELGEEKRQVIAGIGKSYEPEYLVGKNIVIVANLEPRSLMGLESQGMILAAGTDGGPVILVPEKEVPSGSTVG